MNPHAFPVPPFLHSPILFLFAPSAPFCGPQSTFIIRVHPCSSAVQGLSGWEWMVVEPEGATSGCGDGLRLGRGEAFRVPPGGSLRHGACSRLLRATATSRHLPQGGDESRAVQGGGSARRRGGLRRRRGGSGGVGSAPRAPWCGDWSPPWEGRGLPSAGRRFLARRRPRALAPRYGHKCPPAARR